MERRHRGRGAGRRPSIRRRISANRGLEIPERLMSAYMRRLLSRWINLRPMTVSSLGYVFEFWAGLAMSSMFRANDRINLYPAAPIRLATMLHTWTITEQGMGLIFGTAPSPSGHSVTHPTRQQAPPLGDEARWNS